MLFIEVTFISLLFVSTSFFKILILNVRFCQLLFLLIIYFICMTYSLNAGITQRYSHWVTKGSLCTISESLEIYQYICGVDVWETEKRPKPDMCRLQVTAEFKTQLCEVLEC